MANNRRGQINIPLMSIPPEEDIVLKEEEESEDESDVDDEVPIEIDFIFGAETTESPIQNDPLELPIPQGRFNDKTQFTMEMQKEVGQMIRECVQVLNKDPREYHQFYLTVQKWVEIGLKHNHITDDYVPLIWEKSDSFASSEFKRYNKNPIIFEDSLDQPQPAECSKHLGQRRKASNLRSVSRVETDWKRILSSTTSFKNPLSSIKTRLLFFHYAQALTSPKECLQMNSLWNHLLSSQFVADVQLLSTPADLPRNEDNVPNVDDVMLKELTVSKRILQKFTPTSKSSDEEQHEVQSSEKDVSFELGTVEKVQKLTEKQIRKANIERTRLWIQEKDQGEQKNDTERMCLQRLPKQKQILNKNSGHEPSENPEADEELEESSSESLSVNQNLKKKTLEQKREANREYARRHRQRQKLAREQKQAAAEKSGLHKLAKQTQILNQVSDFEDSLKCESNEEPEESSSESLSANQYPQKKTLEQKREANREYARRHRQRQKMAREQEQAAVEKSCIRNPTNEEQMLNENSSESLSANQHFQKKTLEQKREANAERNRRYRLRQKKAREQKQAAAETSGLQKQEKQPQIFNQGADFEDSLKCESNEKLEAYEGQDDPFFESLSANQHLQKKTLEQEREANAEKCRRYRLRLKKAREQNKAKLEKRPFHTLSKEDQMPNESSSGSLSDYQHLQKKTLEQKREANAERNRRYRLRQKKAREQKQAAAETSGLEKQEKQPQIFNQGADFEDSLECESNEKLEADEGQDDPFFESLSANQHLQKKTLEQKREANAEKSRRYRLRLKKAQEQNKAKLEKSPFHTLLKEDQMPNESSSGSLSANQHLQKKTLEQKREANAEKNRRYRLRQKQAREQNEAKFEKRSLHLLTKEDQILNENSPGSLSVNQHRRNRTLEQKLEAQRESARRYRQNMTPEQKEAVAEKRRLRMQANEKQREAARERARRYRAKLAASNTKPGAVQKHQKLTPQQNQQASIEGMRRQRQNMTPEQKQAVTEKRRLRIQTNKEQMPSTKRQKRTPEQKREAARESCRRSRAKLAEMGKTKKERERLQLSSDDELFLETESKINSEECPVRENVVFESKSEFADEMEKVMSKTIQESVQVLEKDPREYHPFYVKLHLFIQAGLEQNFIDAEEVHSIWEKWDSIGVSQFLKKLDVEEKMSVEEFEKIHGPSSHISLILFKRISPSAPKRSWKLADREAQYQTVIQGWRDILSIETSSNDIRSNLALRIKLFQSCASMTFLEDFSRMTKYWGKLFNGELDHLEEKIKMRLSELQKMAEEKEEKKKHESWARYMRHQAWKASLTEEQKQEVAQRKKMKNASLTPEERKEKVKKFKEKRDNFTQEEKLRFQQTCRRQYDRHCQKMEELKKKNFKLWEKTVNEKRIRHQELRVKRATGREMTLEEKEQWLEMRKMNKLTYIHRPKEPKEPKAKQEIPNERKKARTYSSRQDRMERLKNVSVEKWEETKKLIRFKSSVYERKRLLSMTTEKRQRYLADLKIAGRTRTLRGQVDRGKLTEEQMQVKLEEVIRKIEEEAFLILPKPPRARRDLFFKKLEDGETLINWLPKKKQTLKVAMPHAISMVEKGNEGEAGEYTEEVENRYENGLPYVPLLIPVMEEEECATMEEVGESPISSKLKPMDEVASALDECLPMSLEDFKNINAPYEEDCGDFDNHAYSPEVEERIVEMEVKVDEGKKKDEHVIIESFLVKPGSTVKSNLVSTDDNSKSVGESPSSPVDEKGDNDSDENDPTLNSDPAWEPNLDNPESSSSSDDKSDDDNEDASTQDSDPAWEPQGALRTSEVLQDDHAEPKKKSKQPKAPCPKCGVLINAVNLMMHYGNCKGVPPKVNIPFVQSTDSLTCPQCFKVYSGKETLRRHQHNIHGEGAKPENQLRCHLCFKSFQQKPTLDAHIRRVHEGKGFYCELCPNRGDLQSAAKLWKHKVSFHELTDLAPPPNIKVVQCEFCGETVLGRYFTHLKRNHPEMVNKVKINYLQTERNYKSVAGIKDQCPECLKMFHIHALKDHRKKQHGIGIEETFVCPQCNQEFLDKQTLKRHVKVDHNEISDKLRECSLLKMYREGKWTKWKCRLCSEMEIPVSYVRTQAHFITSHNEVYEFFKTGADEKKMLKCFQCQEDVEGGAGLAEHYKEKHKLVQRNPIASKANTEKDKSKTAAKTIKKGETGRLPKYQRHLDRMEKKLKNVSVEKWEETKKLIKFKSSLYKRNRLTSMTPEQRQRRLANSKIAARTKRLREQVDDGELTEEQMEVELEEAKRTIEEETFSKPPKPPKERRDLFFKKFKTDEIPIDWLGKKKQAKKMRLVETGDESEENAEEVRCASYSKKTPLVRKSSRKRTRREKIYDESESSSNDSEDDESDNDNAEHYNKNHNPKEENKIALKPKKKKVEKKIAKIMKPVTKTVFTTKKSISTKDAVPVRKSSRTRTKRKVYYDESDSENDKIDNNDSRTNEVIVNVERDSFMKNEMKILKVSLVRLTEEEIEQYRVKQ